MIKARDTPIQPAERKTINAKNALKVWFVSLMFFFGLFDIDNFLTIIKPTSLTNCVRF